LVIDYRTEDVVSAVRRWAPDGVHRIVEVDIATNLDLDAHVLADGGTVSAYSGSGTVELPRSLMALNAKLEFVLVYTIPDQAKRDAVDTIIRALNDQALTTLPLHRFPLSEIVAAHDAVEAGAVGKVLVDIP
jgi:NADPH2:quinone reductase